MKIIEVQLFPILLPPAGLNLSRSKPVSAQTIIVRVRTDSGLSGLGEVGVNPGDEARTYATLASWLKTYRAAVTGADALNINALHQRMDHANRQNPPGCHPARAAIDMAVHDLIGKARGCPVHEILGGAYRPKAQVAARIMVTSVGDIVSTVRSHLEAGYRALTIDLGSDVLPSVLSMARLKENCEHICAVLESIGTNIAIDVDAIQSLGNPALVSRLFEQVLSKCFYPNVALVQPLNKFDLLGHADLRQKLPIPIVLTESVVSAESIMQVARIGAADRIGLSLERVGGLRNAMNIADICEAAAIGITPILSSFAGIGVAALSHLAVALHDPYPVDTGNYQAVPLGLIIGGPTVQDGWLSVSNKPGLGVEIDDELLQTFGSS